MKLSYYNIACSIVKSINEANGIYANTLLADQIKYNSAIASELILYLDFYDFDDDEILPLLEIYYRNDEKSLSEIDNLTKAFFKIRELNKAKHKKRESLIYIGRYKSVMGLWRESLKTHITKKLEKLHLLKLIPFEAEDVWDLVFIDLNPQDNKEDDILTEISDTLTQREYILSLDMVVEQLFEGIALESKQTSGFDFIKIPLWTLPFLTELNYAQMKYTREDLRSSLLPFHAAIKELFQKLFDIEFSAENMKSIENFYSETILPCRESVQQSINNSLYLSQLRNQQRYDEGMIFCLGICKVEMFADYFDKAKIVEPYIASQIKQRVSREMDLKTAYVFTYYEIHGNAIIESVPLVK
jgi:hypothetical protein